jgi:hypothetical protein
MSAPGPAFQVTFAAGEHWIVLQDPAGNEFCVR